MAAIFARATQHDIVCGYDVPAPVGDSLDRRFERGFFERLDLPAVVADEMVVMVAARVRGSKRAIPSPRSMRWTRPRAIVF